MRRNGRAIPDNKIKQIYTLLSKGLKTVEISEILDIPEGSLSSYRNMFNALSSGGEISRELEQKYQSASRIAYEFFDITPPKRQNPDKNENPDKNDGNTSEKKCSQTDNTDYKVLRELEHFHDFFESFVDVDYAKTNEKLLIAVNALTASIMSELRKANNAILEMKNAIVIIQNELKGN